jgi:RND superfamily putative drug exporter
VLARLARFCYRRRRLVLVAWVAFLAVAIAAGGALKGKWATTGRLPGTDSQAAYDLLKQEFPAKAGDEAAFVFADVSADPPAVATFLQKAAAVPGVMGVENPPEIAPDGRTATASFTLANNSEATRKAAVQALSSWPSR